MRKLATIFTSFFAGICLFIIPINQHSVLASDLPLTVNIPDGKNAQATSKGLKIDTEADGSVTFSGKTEANATIKIVKHGGNNGRYTVEADDNGNFSKSLKLATRPRSVVSILPPLTVMMIKVPKQVLLLLILLT